MVSINMDPFDAFILFLSVLGGFVSLYSISRILVLWRVFVSGNKRKISYVFEKRKGFGLYSSFYTHSYSFALFWSFWDLISVLIILSILFIGSYFSSYSIYFPWPHYFLVVIGLVFGMLPPVSEINKISAYWRGIRVEWKKGAKFAFVYKISNILLVILLLIIPIFAIIGEILKTWKITSSIVAPVIFLVALIYLIITKGSRVIVDWW